MIFRICRNPFLYILVVLSVTIAGAQHFPSNEALQDLIGSRVEEERAVGIVLGVLEADGSTRIVSYGNAGTNAQPLVEQPVNLFTGR